MFSEALASNQGPNSVSLEHRECRYCQFMNAELPVKHSAWDKPVLESANFTVVPSLGHLVPGWLLVIPRFHYASLGALSPDLVREFLMLKAESESLLNSIYGPVVKFEHGSCSHMKAGACIDHAHMHLVPTAEDFGSHLAHLFGGERLTDIGRISLKWASRPYLLYENAMGIATVYETPLLPSQFMRMLIAQRLGVLERYDWRKYPGIDELKTFWRDLESIRRNRNVICAR